MTTLQGSVKLYNGSDVFIRSELIGSVELVEPFSDPLGENEEEGGVAAPLEHYIFTISAQNITDKKITLSVTPSNPDSVIFIPEGGIPQFSGVDFSVNGTDLSWDGLGLDGFIEEDEIIHVYF
jgi:hypothetical protein